MGEVGIRGRSWRESQNATYNKKRVRRKRSMFIWLGIEKIGWTFLFFPSILVMRVLSLNHQPNLNMRDTTTFSTNVFLILCSAKKVFFLPSTVSHNCWSFLSSNKYTWTVTRKEKLDQTLNPEKVHLRIFRFFRFLVKVFLFYFFDIFIPVDCVLRQIETQKVFSGWKLGIKNMKEQVTR